MKVTLPAKQIISVPFPLGFRFLFKDVVNVNRKDADPKLQNEINMVAKNIEISLVLLYGRVMIEIEWKRK